MEKRVSNQQTIGANRLLSLLPQKDLRRLTEQMDRVSLSMRQLLYEAGQKIDYVYFPLSGVTSLVVVMKDGSAAEVATVGNEGVVGIPAYLGAAESPTRSFCQIAGELMRIRTGLFIEEAQRSIALQRVMHRYTQAYINQVSQSVACNHMHAVEQRMCRWLLMTHDRVHSDELTLTQDFLAQMLGVRRPSVSVVAGMLQKAGLISYSRGKIRILDRQRLEESACECYGVVRAEFERLLGFPG